MCACACACACAGAGAGAGVCVCVLMKVECVNFLLPVLMFVMTSFVIFILKNMINVVNADRFLIFFVEFLNISTTVVWCTNTNRNRC